MKNLKTIAVFAGIFAVIASQAWLYFQVRSLNGAAVVSSKQREPVPTVGTTGGVDKDSLVLEIKRQLQDEMGLLPLALMRERRRSFLELESWDDLGRSSYGTAGYLGRGYFVTVKHAVIALGNGRRITKTILRYRGEDLPASLVDAGNAEAEVDPGDWAILKIAEVVDLPALHPDPDYEFGFADPIFRLGNDYSKGIILSTGFIGQRTANGLVTSLTDGHPGVSGGGVLDKEGNLVGIPVGRMAEDYRFSFFLPIREEMFRRVPFLSE